MAEILAILMFPCLLGFILLGYPVAFTLSGTAILFGALGSFLGVFSFMDFSFVPFRIFGIIQNFTLLAVPLFVFMGLTLEKTGLAEDLLKTLGYLLRKQKGSLALAVVAVGGLLAASTGIVGATVVTMGVLSLPTMLNSGYGRSISTGTIAASGTLGQIIPPSIVLIILGDMMGVDVGNLFIGSVIPGLILLVLYFAYIKSYFIFTSNQSQSPSHEYTPLDIHQIFATLAPPIALILLVLGSILMGIASPTEAAGCGAFASILVSTIKKRLSRSSLIQVCVETSLITSMVFFVLIGAQFFGVVFRGLGGDDLVTDLLVGNSLGPQGALFLIMLTLFILGFFLDFLEICFIVIPIIYPIIKSLGFDPLWVAILVALNLQTSFLTPPFGFALFYLKGVAPPTVKTTDIYKGVVPFIGIQLAVLILIWVWPALVTHLPRNIF